MERKEVAVLRSDQPHPWPYTRENKGRTTDVWIPWCLRRGCCKIDYANTEAGAQTILNPNIVTDID